MNQSGELVQLALVAQNARKIPKLLFSFVKRKNIEIVARNALDVMRKPRWRGYLNHNKVTCDDIIHKALRWICNSQDMVGTGGVGCYEFYRWTSGYPEVTGYIIPTFWECYEQYADPALKERALKMADWCISIQRPTGGWEGGYQGDGKPDTVFNTGQIIRGLIATFEHTGDEKHLHSAIRAANWIVEAQDIDGSWTRHNYKGMKRVYDTYVSAALARLFSITGNQTYAGSANLNCEFAIRQQLKNGWFDLCDNTVKGNSFPVTHTIAYTIDGLLETGRILKNNKFIDSGKLAADAILERYADSGILPARLDNRWNKSAWYSCNTGNAQMGIIYMTLHDIYGTKEYLEYAKYLLDHLAYVQDLNSVGDCCDGGIAGSYPVWGLYCPFKFPSWGAKYLIDLALMVSGKS